MDAGHVFPERENRPIPQHPPVQSLRQGLPQRRCPLQYQSLSHLRLLNAPGPLPLGQANLQP